MGSYNSQYESYYCTLVNKRKNSGGYNYNRSRNQPFALDGKFFMRRLVVDLIGVFVLFIFVIACKMVVTPQTTAAYKYSKEVLNKNYDYKYALESIKKIDLKAIEDKPIDWIDGIKAKLTGTKTFKDRIKSDYMVPIEGAITLEFGEKSNAAVSEKKFHEGIDIAAKEGTEINCSYDGKVTDVGEDAQLGKYIVVDHGSGIETKYAGLGDIFVKRDDTVKKGEVIAKSGKTGEAGEPQLHFELLNMGENENPEDYLDFSRN